MIFSHDKDIETLSQLIEMLKHNLEVRAEYAKVSVVDKMVRLLSAAALAFFILLIVMMGLLFLSAGIAHWLSQYVGMAAALFIVAGGYVLLLMLLLIFRKRWIERPLVRYLSSLLID